jgi:diguanylate cyclase (GGDEF)-like protein
LGEKQFISTRYFSDIDWFLIVIQDESLILKDIRTATFFSLLVGFFATFFVLCVTVWNVNRYQGRLEIMATTDSLTGLFNRRYFMSHVEKELIRAERTKHTLSLVLLDLDRFKRINDTFGHSVGDRVLREIAKLLSKDLRDMDILSRVGGEEFAMLLPETSVEGACEVAERIRISVEKNGFNLPDINPPFVLSPCSCEPILRQHSFSY